MRGAQTLLDGLLRGPGIIPAYAGSTSGWDALGLTVWDHPRVCGEHNGALISGASLEGSSPRMRGAHSVSLMFKKFTGIIPAYAGST